MLKDGPRDYHTKWSKSVLGKLVKQSSSGFRGRSRPLTDLWPYWTACLLAHLTTAASKSSSTYDKKGNGSWNFLSPGDLASPLGSGKSCDSHDEINSIVKPEPELHFWAQTDNSLRPLIITEAPRTLIWSLTCGVDVPRMYPGPFPTGAPDCCYLELPSCCLDLEVGAGPIRWCKYPVTFS